MNEARVPSDALIFLRRRQYYIQNQQEEVLLTILVGVNVVTTLDELSPGSCSRSGGETITSAQLSVTFCSIIIPLGTNKLVTVAGNSCDL